MRQALVIFFLLIVASVQCFDVPTKSQTNSKTPEKEKAPTPPPKSSESDDEGSVSFALEHNLGKNGFAVRSNVELVFGQGKTNVRFSDSELSSGEVTALQKLIASRDYYSVRVVPPRRDGSAASPVTASVPACALAASGFRELFTFHTDVYGNVIAVDYRVPITDCPTTPAKLSDVKFQPKGKIALGRAGERPKDIHRTVIAPMGDPEQQAAQQQQANAQQQQQQDQKDGKQPAEPPKSFFQQYWMYLLIGFVVLMQLTSAAGGGPGGAAAGAS